MNRAVFRAPEYHADGSFRETWFRFEGDADTGWTLFRADKPTLSLGPGYVLVQALSCGVCATDLARRFLPFPLPQIIGHETVGKYEGERVVVEINASHKARGLPLENCAFCANDLDTHCPARRTLGIHDLPGGFGSLFLAPVNAMLPVPECVSSDAASFTEPLAAAMRAVEISPPGEGEAIAVLGPRRLGMLIVAALAVHRRETGKSFRLAAISRHDALLELARELGADDALRPEETRALGFDRVFDTTGNPDGFAFALERARHEVHLKSTHGQSVMGLHHLTDLVVDELAIEAYESGSSIAGSGSNVWLSPSVGQLTDEIRHFGHQAHVLPHREAFVRLEQEGDYPPGSPLPRFDSAVVGDWHELDWVVRPEDDAAHALIKPLGTIYLECSRRSVDNPLAKALARGVRLSSSRCGSFSKALSLLENHPQIASLLAERMITHRFGNHAMAEAFGVAADSSRSIKVLITHPSQS